MTSNELCDVQIAQIASIDRDDRPAAGVDVRSQLTARIVTIVREQAWRQKEAAHRLGVDQSTVSRLLSGKSGSVSLERLLEMLNRLGHDVTVTISQPRRDRPGRTIVLTR